MVSTKDIASWNAHIAALPMSMFGVMKIITQIQHSVEQARIPGNDWRRELDLIENLTFEALAAIMEAKNDEQ